MDGVLNVYKPEGPTSHDIVNRVRRLYGQKRVGHAGTLDPMATGVLVICLGKATRIVEYLMGTQKEYHAKLTLGASTDSQDSTGEILEEHDASNVDEEMLAAVIKDFIGEITQVPPMMSAIKHKGKPLYKLAREGVTIERAGRKVTIYDIDILDFTPGERASADIVVKCSSGTYIRTLCADIGEKLGCGGHMSALQRTRVGAFSLDESATIEQLEAAKEESRIEETLIKPADALRDFPSLQLDDDDMRRIKHGNAIFTKDIFSGDALVRLIAPDSSLAALATASLDEGVSKLSPCKVFIEETD